LIFAVITPAGLTPLVSMMRPSTQAGVRKNYVTLLSLRVCPDDVIG
jgi:hypothetical protein